MDRQRGPDRRRGRAGAYRRGRRRAERDERAAVSVRYDAVKCGCARKGRAPPGLRIAASTRAGSWPPVDATSSSWPRRDAPETRRTDDRKGSVHLHCVPAHTIGGSPDCPAGSPVSSCGSRGPDRDEARSAGDDLDRSGVVSRTPFVQASPRPAPTRRRSRSAIALESDQGQDAGDQQHRAGPDQCTTTVRSRARVLARTAERAVTGSAKPSKRSRRSAPARRPASSTFMRRPPRPRATSPAPAEHDEGALEPSTA